MNQIKMVRVAVPKVIIPTSDLCAGGPWCEQCGACLGCCWEDPCAMGGDHRARVGLVESGAAGELD